GPKPLQSSARPSPPLPCAGHTDDESNYDEQGVFRGPALFSGAASERTSLHRRLRRGGLRGRCDEEVPRQTAEPQRGASASPSLGGRTTLPARSATRRVSPISLLAVERIYGVCPQAGLLPPLAAGGLPDASEGSERSRSRSRERHVEESPLGSLQPHRGGRLLKKLGCGQGEEYVLPADDTVSTI
ncbi:LC1, partial [Symbiodinium sp. CCMP2456]